MDAQTSTTHITAVPAGRDRDGNPLTGRHDYEADSRREDWGDNCTRIFVRRPDLDVANSKWGPAFAPAVVLTDSIQAVTA
ncbi:hypothetical protein [Segeticoccus rhizosphaerae]|jgi:hypothetical protein|uniref:hypothetical protein n=1 Tax=Segeticoccus rhizosphaerae TaxID=1104777 RepID=UPI0012653D24|nr:hypothetical protein [Segeticoccus rhizosphaerae]